jgi:putative tricarboxylic transport membrane protein
MAEGVEVASQGDKSGFAQPRKFHGAIIPIAMGLIGVWGAWRMPATSGAPTTLMLTSAGLIVFGGIITFLGYKIRDPRDYYGGLALLGLAMFALWASGDLPGMRGFAFGPGTAPRLFAMILGLLGIGVMLVGLLTEGPGLERYGIRGPVLITASTLVFAFTIRHFGLVIASYISIVLASFATDEVRPLEALVWAAILTTFCCVLFPIGLNLPIPLWPQNLTFSTILQFR